MALFVKKKYLTELSVKTEYHCHLLPGVDDGIQKREESFALLKKMQDVGYSKVFLTPHINPDIFPENTEPFLRRRFEIFKTELPADISLDLTLSAEYMVEGTFCDRIAPDMLYFEVDGKKYVLIEMSYYYISNEIEDALFKLSLAGFIPVLAHPERYLYLASSLKVFEKYHDMGCKFQLNLLSLSGIYGQGSIKIMKYLLGNRWYRFVGSDAHSIEHFEKIQTIKMKSDLFDKLLEISNLY